MCELGAQTGASERLLLHQQQNGGEMARSKSLTSQLYRLARLSATGRSIRRGYAGRRAKNIIVGRALGRAGVWRRLWR
jgi:hypothetical protein